MKAIPIYNPKLDHIFLASEKHEVTDTDGQTIVTAPLRANVATNLLALTNDHEWADVTDSLDDQGLAVNALWVEYAGAIHKVNRFQEGDLRFKSSKARGAVCELNTFVSFVLEGTGFGFGFRLEGSCNVEIGSILLTSGKTPWDFEIIGYSVNASRVNRNRMYSKN